MTQIFFHFFPHFESPNDRSAFILMQTKVSALDCVFLLWQERFTASYRNRVGSTVDENPRNMLYYRTLFLFNNEY